MIALAKENSLETLDDKNDYNDLILKFLLFKGPGIIMFLLLLCFLIWKTVRRLLDEKNG